MKICERHWNELKARLETEGLMPFVSKSGAEAAKRMVKAVADGYDKDNFDPLMYCNMEIIEGALEALGPAKFQELDEACPVCEVAQYAIANCPCGKPHDPKDIEDHWIDGPARKAVRLANKIGVLPVT